MRRTLTLPLALAGLGAVALLPSSTRQTASAQVVATPRTRIYRAPGATSVFGYDRDDEPRAAVGISTSGSMSARDTLGLLVNTVVPGSPAEKAGIEEGNRIAAINGTSLRLAAADVGDWDMVSALSRRLTRELSKAKPGDEVELRVYANGQFRNVKVRTADSDSLYRRRSTRSSDDRDERAVLGIGFGSTGSRRDTLGVLVMSVDDSTPAARAGLEEGNRIAAIDGVDLRVSSQDAGDDMIGDAKMRRLQREMEKVKPGDDVALRVYANGQFRNVKVKAIRAGDLPRRSRRIFINGGGMGIGVPPMPPMPPMRLDIDGREIGDNVRRALERALEAAGRSMEGVGRTLDGVGRGLDRTRIEWDDAFAPTPPTPPLPSAAPRGQDHARELSPERAGRRRIA